MSASLVCVIDIEASGFGRRSYPIEVGYVLPDGRTRCTLIRPPEHWTHWDQDAERVHHISRETLMRHGRTTGEVARMLNADLQGLTVYCDGWGHDYPWLAALFDELTPGMLAKKVYEGDGAYAVVQLISRSQPKVEDFDKDADRMVEELRGERAQQFVEEWLKERCEKLAADKKIKPNAGLLRETDDKGNLLPTQYHPCMSFR